VSSPPLMHSRLSLLVLGLALAVSLQVALAFAGSSDARASVMAHVAGNFALKGFVHASGDEVTPTQEKLEQEMLSVRRDVENRKADIEAAASRPVAPAPLGNTPEERRIAAELEHVLQRSAAPALVETGAQTSQRSRAFQRALEKAHAQLATANQNQFIGRVLRKVVNGAKRFLNLNPKFLAVKFEDCMACRYIWSQVEMDVANARYVEDVQASFEHNCLDSQKTEIFYKACEDMYDDMYAMTDDYMTNEYTVDTMCKRANMCKTGGNDNGIHRVFN